MAAQPPRINMPKTRKKTEARTKAAGMEASAHFSMNTTIEPNDMRMSVMTTDCGGRNDGMIGAAWVVSSCACTTSSGAFLGREILAPHAEHAIAFSGEKGEYLTAIAASHLGQVTVVSIVSFMGMLSRTLGRMGQMGLDFAGDEVSADWFLAGLGLAAGFLGTGWREVGESGGLRL